MLLKWIKRDIRTVSEEETMNALRSMSPQRFERIQNKRCEADRMQSITGELLVRQLVRENTDLSADETVILNEKCGKPYLKDCGLHISISHTGNFALAAISDIPVGIDAEALRTVDLRIANRICNDAEKNYIFSDNGDDTDVIRFFRIWTLKEACSKCIGSGLRSVADFNVMPVLTLSQRQDDLIISVVSQNCLEQTKQSEPFVP